MKDFDRGELTSLDVTIADPDEFPCETFDQKPKITFAAAWKSFDFHGSSNPERSWKDCVEVIGNFGKPNNLQSFAERLREFAFDDE